MRKSNARNYSLRRLKIDTFVFSRFFERATDVISYLARAGRCCMDHKPVRTTPFSKRISGGAFKTRAARPGQGFGLADV